jgi:hypothetical protein
VWFMPTVIFLYFFTVYYAECRGAVSYNSKMFIPLFPDPELYFFVALFGLFPFPLFLKKSNSSSVSVNNIKTRED